MSLEISPEKERLSQDEELRARIISAAIRRFSYFGIQKTTLAEIADDTNIPRHTLNELFPDKSSLIKAAEEEVVADYLGKLHAIHFPEGEVPGSLKMFVDIRLAFFEKYFMLINQKDNIPFFEWAEYLNHVINNVRQKEIEFVSGILQNVGTDAKRVAETILKALYAMETAFRVSIPIPSSDDFLKLKEEELNLVSLFYNGIKHS